MSTDAIALPRTELASRPFVDALHEWVTTVDHKRLGILYLGYALLFLVIGGSKRESCAFSLSVRIMISSRRRFSTAYLPCTAPQ
jgi:hypothetical protein